MIQQAIVVGYTSPAKPKQESTYKVQPWAYIMFLWRNFKDAHNDRRKTERFKHFSEYPYLLIGWLYARKHTGLFLLKI